MLDCASSVAAPACDHSYTAAQASDVIQFPDEVSFSAPTHGRGTDASTEYVRAYLQYTGMIFRFDGSPQPLQGAPKATRPEDMRAALRYEPPTLESLEGDLVLAAREADLKIPNGIIRRSLRKLQREARANRREAVLDPLNQSLDPAEQLRANRMWRELVTAAFDMDAELAIALLQHFMHQVKTKAGHREVHHHMMPIIVSRHQEAGKTTFVNRLVAPLQDLASDPALLTDLSDKRCQQILSYPVVVVDDCEHIRGQQVAILKSLLTAEHVNRRNLGTSLSSSVSQLATMIGTANQDVDVLIEDPSGHRRFPQMTFRIDPNSPDHAAAWDVINATDFHLLWRSVDVFKPSPILQHLPALRDLQAQHTQLCEVEEWLAELRPNDPEYAEIRTEIGLKAQGLYKLFEGSTGSRLTMSAWGRRMGQLTRRPEMPLCPKRKVPAGTVYPIRAA